MDNGKALFQQIMQRFRPIIPKPVSTTGDQSGSAVKGEERVLRKRRTKKRKYIRSAASKCKKLMSPREKERNSIFTLQLLPVDQQQKKDSQTPPLLMNCIMEEGGCTEEEMIMNLEKDTCPGFISDGENNVKWVNMAYRRMVCDDDQKGRAPPQVVVKLVAMRRDLAAELRWVRVLKKQQYCCSRQIIVPCDVWRMEFGGLAWRLDVQAALSLGPPS